MEAKGFRRWLDVSERVFDLSDLFDDISLLKAPPEEVLDSEINHDVIEDDT